jgi:signal transduction histidine kinase
VSFRTRLFLALLLAVLVPLVSLAYGVRREMGRRLTAEYEERLASIASAMESDLDRESRTVAGRLAALASELATSDRFRRAALRNEPASRRYLLDFGGGAMALSGLALFQVQDSSGKILTSGHFRNEYDRLQPELPRLLAQVGGMALVQTRTAQAPLLALARLDSFVVGGSDFTVVGGVEAGGALLGRLARSNELSLSLVYPGKDPGTPPKARVVRELPIPYLNLLSPSAIHTDTARFQVTQSLATLEALRRDVNRWFLIALALTVAVSLVLAAWLASLVSRPLRELARKTAEIDLDRLDQPFDSERSDEIGALSRLLGAMTQRLRVSSVRLRDAERRAAVGDLARQVNHDIKNGLAPIRNVVRHLTQIGRDEPQRLPAVFDERRGTLESSVEYLDTLARNYARLSPGPERQPCDVNMIVQQVLQTSARNGTELKTNLGHQLPPVLGDPLMFRRILENLVGNAIESLSRGGTVTVSTAESTDKAGVRITVADTGPGMTREQLERAFDDFYTTKESGTGLGLSIVRRLVMDLNGSVRVETEPGAGTRVVLHFPAASTRSPATAQ